MAHPFHEHRQTKIEHSRVGHITKAYAHGGAVKHSDEKQDRKLVKSMIDKAIHPEGHKSKHRMDRPKRAKRAEGGPIKMQPGDNGSVRVIDPRTGQVFYSGSASGAANAQAQQAARIRRMESTGGKVTRAKGGRVKGSKGNARTVINVITGGHPAGGAVPSGPPPPPMGIAGPLPGGMAPPPMAAKPPMPPMGPPGDGPRGGPPMPLRAKGGRVHKPHGSPVFNESLKTGTQVQHTDGKDDGKDIGRGRVVTFWAGGKVSKGGYGPKQTPTRAKGGRVESPDGIAPATKLPGGSGGGKGRLAKEHRAERDYARPAR